MPPIPLGNFLTILGTHGTPVTWYLKTTGSADPFDTGSIYTYGYGDPQTILTSGSFNAVVVPRQVDEKLIEPGFYLEDYYALFFKADDAPNYFDYASFMGQLRQILPVQERIDFGRTVFKRAFARVIIPSGSNSILPDYLAQIAP